ncbi:MAG: hypothetical protein ACRC35_12765 [Angustibacter sp.]
MDPASVLAAAAVTLFGTLAAALLVAPLLSALLIGPAADELPAGFATDPPSAISVQTFGASLILGSSTRVVAGVCAARSYRRRWGTGRRWEPVTSVVVGAVSAWAGYALLVGWASAATSVAWPWSLLLELPRWVVEAVLGASLAPAGPARSAARSVKHG